AVEVFAVEEQEPAVGFFLVGQLVVGGEGGNCQEYSCHHANHESHLIAPWWDTLLGVWKVSYRQSLLGTNAANEVGSHARSAAVPCRSRRTISSALHVANTTPPPTIHGQTVLGAGSTTMVKVIVSGGVSTGFAAATSPGSPISQKPAQ